ncbi:hypothetical protein B4Q13_25525, partial [Lacticaseibacillus rhamnosus]
LESPVGVEHAPAARTFDLFELRFGGLDAAPQHLEVARALRDARRDRCDVLDALSEEGRQRAQRFLALLEARAQPSVDALVGGVPPLGAPLTERATRPPPGAGDRQMEGRPPRARRARPARRPPPERRGWSAW